MRLLETGYDVAQFSTVQRTFGDEFCQIILLAVSFSCTLQKDSTLRRSQMDTITPLVTATATATGGRNGHTESSDGRVSADLSVPKEMGGLGRPNTTTPEHLFAAGYAACFGGALDYV